MLNHILNVFFSLVIRTEYVFVQHSVYVITERKKNGNGEKVERTCRRGPIDIGATHGRPRTCIFTLFLSLARAHGRVLHNIYGLHSRDNDIRLRANTRNEIDDTSGDRGDDHSTDTIERFITFIALFALRTGRKINRYLSGQDVVHTVFV